ncbi:MAG: diacylglycerol/lipid kinase family protein [Bacteroidota bacterium]
MKKAIVIYNPISGKGQSAAAANAMKTSALSKQYDFTFIPTEYHEHATEIVKKYLVEGIKNFIAIGGDGTINEIGAVLKNTDAILGIIPTGSGNGLAKHIGMSTNVEIAIKQLAIAETKSIDTLEINNHFAVNVSGFGFDGYVAYRFNHYGKRGLSTYTKIGLSEYFHYPLQNFEISINDQIINVKKHMLVIANASQFGNAAIIAPSANITDGILELVAVELPPLFKIPKVLYRLFTGRIKDDRNIQTYKCTSFKASSSKKVHLHIDGESMEPVKEIQVVINPQSLNILVPKHVK